jgi:hypothetical protein
LGPVPSDTRPLSGDPPDETVKVVSLRVVALIGSLNCTVTSRFVATSVLAFGGMTCATVGGVVSETVPVEKVAVPALSSGMPEVFFTPTVIATVNVPEGANGAVGVNRTNVFGPRSLAWNESVPGTAAVPFITVNVAAPPAIGVRLTVGTSSV